MSDIIYTPPASSGGGTTINPTNDFIPVRSNATTFIDSVLFNDANVLQTNNNFGFYCSFTNRVFSIGDFNEGNNATYLSINDNNQLIKTINQANDIGLKLDFNNSVYYFGDYNNLGNGAFVQIDNFNGAINLYSKNGSNTNLFLDGNNLEAYLYSRFVEIGDGNNNNTRFQIDDFNQIIKTISQSNEIGLKLDFANNEYFFGDYNNITNGAVLICSVINQTIFTRTSVGNPLGIKTDFLNNQFALGDFDGINNSTFVNVSDTAKQIRLYTSGGEIGFDCDLLNFNGVLTSGSASGSSGQHLQVTINGTPYVIALLNP
jgi:hypothetical protein